MLSPVEVPNRVAALLADGNVVTGSAISRRGAPPWGSHGLARLRAALAQDSYRWLEPDELPPAIPQSRPRKHLDPCFYFNVMSNPIGRAACDHLARLYSEDDAARRDLPDFPYALAGVLHWFGRMNAVLSRVARDINEDACRECLEELATQEFTKDGQLLRRSARKRRRLTETSAIEETSQEDEEEEWEPRAPVTVTAAAAAVESPPPPPAVVKTSAVLSKKRPLPAVTTPARPFTSSTLQGFQKGYGGDSSVWAVLGEEFLAELNSAASYRDGLLRLVDLAGGNPSAVNGISPGYDGRRLLGTLATADSRALVLPAAPGETLKVPSLDEARSLIDASGSHFTPRNPSQLQELLVVAMQSVLRAVDRYPGEGTTTARLLQLCNEGGFGPFLADLDRAVKSGRKDHSLLNYFKRFVETRKLLEATFVRSRMRRVTDDNGRLVDLIYEDDKDLQLGKDGRVYLLGALRRCHYVAPALVEAVAEEIGTRYSDLRNAQVRQLVRLALLLNMWQTVLEAARVFETRKDVDVTRVRVAYTPRPPSEAMSVAEFLYSSSTQTTTAAV